DRLPGHDPAVARGGHGAGRVGLGEVDADPAIRAGARHTPGDVVGDLPLAASVRAVADVEGVAEVPAAEREVAELLVDAEVEVVGLAGCGLPAEQQVGDLPAPGVQADHDRVVLGRRAAEDAAG